MKLSVGTLGIFSSFVTSICLLSAVSLLLAQPCLAKTCYVNTASSGGDGTTNATSGANAAYASLFDWEAAEDDHELTEPMIVYCEGSAADATAVTIADWTGNSATDTITITTTQANRHNGKWDETKYRLEVDISWNGSLDIDIPYVQVEGLQIYNTSTTTNSAFGIYLDDIATSGWIKVFNCIIKANYYGICHYYVPAGFQFYGKNNIIYDADRALFFRTDAATDYDMYLYNNTVITDAHAGTHGYVFWRCDGDMRLKNNIAQNASSGCFENASPGGNIVTDYADNLSSDATAPGADAYHNTTVTFLDSANKDFRLSSKDTAAKNKGTDLSTDNYLSFSDDI